MTIDPITLSVIQARLMQVCDEMDLAFSRAAFSPVIAEANDRSDGIYDPVDGSLIAQGAGGLPVFVGTMQYSTRTLIEMINAGRVLPPEPGDIYIVNDPYLGGTHLMDVRFAQPYYRDGEIFCWLSNTGHWPDTGGAVPGGFSASATAVEQEGLRLPPVKLFKRGEMDQEIYSIICSNIRVADQRIGDVKAQAAALDLGAERMDALLDRYGTATVKQAIAELRSRAATQMRSFVGEIPLGPHSATAWIDSDGVVDEPLAIHLTVSRDDDSLVFTRLSSSRLTVKWMAKGSSTTPSLSIHAVAECGPSGISPTNVRICVAARLRSSAMACLTVAVPYRSRSASIRSAPKSSAAACALTSPIRWSATRMLEQMIE